MNKKELSKVLSFINNCRIEDLDHRLQEQVKKSFLDLVMVFCAGSHNVSTAKVAEFVENYYSGDEATIITNGKRTSLLGASIVNANAANALDLDDGFSLTKGHPGAGIIGGMLAASEAVDCTYGDFLSALLVGYELCIRQGLCLQDYYNFYHSTGSYAGFGTAAAIGKLFKLSDEQMSNALGIADYYGPLVPCMRTVNVPSLNKDGIYLGSKLGMEAVLLAKSGIDGGNIILLDEKYESFVDSLGEKYYVNDIYYKFFSCCRWAQGALSAIKDLKSQTTFNYKDVRSIKVYSYGASGELFDGMPTNEVEAQYNLKYPIASYLIHGEFGPIQSSLDIDNSDDVKALMDCTTFILDDEYEKLFPALRFTRVKIRLLDGTVIESKPTEPMGDSSETTDLNTIIAKGQRINSIFNSQDRIDELIHMILNSDYQMKFSNLFDKIKVLTMENGETA